jgi:hypothetical protein
MDRRDFFRILSATSAGALAESCGRKGDTLIMGTCPTEDCAACHY